MDEFVKFRELVLSISFAFTLGDILSVSLFGNKGDLLASICHTPILAEFRKRSRSCWAASGNPWMGEGIQHMYLRCICEPWCLAYTISSKCMYNVTVLALPSPVYRLQKWGLSRLGSKKANQTSNLYLPEPKVKAFKWCTEKKKGLEL
jgi:hypothetical protein